MKGILKFSVVQTIPVMLGYLFMGAAFGLLLQEAGYNFIWAFFISLTVYAGSGQFLLVSLLNENASVLTTAIMTLSINCRHFFYGLSFIERFKKMGKKYLYMIFSLTDETYSLLCSTKIPDNLDYNKTTFTMAFLNQLYWICGCVIGDLMGMFLPFSTDGVDFAMTALFVVIFVEQWLSTKNHLPAVMGCVSAVICLLIFGIDGFILPTLILCVAGLMAFKSKILEVE